MRTIGHIWAFLGIMNLIRSGTHIRVLPFGLSTACYVFTKLLRPLVKRWRSRSRGLRGIVYIDDGICVSKSLEQCAVDTKVIVDDLADFILNETKSKLSPRKLVSGLV